MFNVSWCFRLLGFLSRQMTGFRVETDAGGKVLRNAFIIKNCATCSLGTFGATCLVWGFPVTVAARGFDLTMAEFQTTWPHRSENAGDTSFKSRPGLKNKNLAGVCSTSLAGQLCHTCCWPGQTVEADTHG